jgi:sigma-B regulation protein RsbU (phosphoserine phosphatase)
MEKGAGGMRRTNLKFHGGIFMNRTEQKSKVRKEEKRAKKQQEKELFLKYKPDFQDEMNEKSSLYTRNFTIICGSLVFLLIFSDKINFPNYPELPYARIACLLWFLIGFILTRLKTIKNYFSWINAFTFGGAAYSIAFILAVANNAPDIASTMTVMIVVAVLFSNLSSLKTALIVILNIFLFISFNIMFKNDMTTLNFKGALVNLICFTAIGLVMHNILYRLKKNDFFNRRRLDEQNIQLDSQNHQMTKELKIGQTVQQSLLGNLPQKLGGLFLFLERHPFSEVSGDFYDLIEVGKNKCFFLLGDVSGHGVSAALITTMAKSLFNSLTREDISTAQLCEVFNKQLSVELKDSGFYLTGIVLKIDLERGVIEYTNAGHTEPYFYKKAENALEKLSTEDPILGMFDAKYKSKSIQMKEGDRLLLYTDGLYEAKNERDEQYLTIFDQDFRSAAESGASNLSKALFEKAAKWGEEKGFNDDVTLLSFEG